MSEHVWFVPVTAGWPQEPTPVPPGVHTPWEFNVQWDFTQYPTTQIPPPDVANVRVVPYTMFTPANLAGQPNTPARLNGCHGSWAWRSCTDGEIITVGGQLAVGTVLSRFLPVWLVPPVPGHDPPVGSPYTWNMVEAWVKYSIGVPPGQGVPLSAINFTLNDLGGNWADPWAPPAPAPTDWLPSTVAGAWRVIYTKKAGNWTGWNDTNLRAVLTVLGTTVPANVGRVTVSVEWFAFRLSNLP
jgi:hypothetical protein